ncbi:MAG: outer membrane protein assembly factor BamD [Thermodesulfobacteriota bacterium]
MNKPSWNRMIALGLVLLALTALLTLSGCASLKQLFSSSKGEELESSPQTMAYEAMEQLEAENYNTAAATFQKLKDRFPYSRYAILAELKLADALYYKAAYGQAIEAYAEFERLHPNNEAVPYTIYQQGMGYYKLMRGFERDQEPVVKALQTFSRLLQSYPEDKHAAMATARMMELQNSLAGHEFAIGQFYFKMKAYKAALGRFVSLIKHYPDTGYHQTALEMIKVCRERIVQQEKRAAAKAQAREEKLKAEAAQPKTEDKTNGAGRTEGEEKTN